MKLENYYIDKVIKSFIENELKQNSSEVFSTTYDNKKIWIKRARATGSTKIHKLLYKLLRFDSLRPVESKNSEEAVIFESSKLIRFKKIGILTPIVLAYCSEYMVLEDCGKMVNSYIRKKDIPKEKMDYYINNMIDVLSLIHNKNEYHGGAQARNFTFLDNKFYVIDLEDSFDKNVDLSFLQFRDFLFFLLSLAKTRASFELDYEVIINKYMEQTNNFEFKEKLKKLAFRVSIFIKISEINFINNLLGRDVQGFFKLFKILRGL